MYQGRHFVLVFVVPLRRDAVCNIQAGLTCGFLEEINLVWFISGGHTLKYPSPFE